MPDTVYRGDETVDGPYGIMPLDRQEARYQKMAETGETIRMPRYSSTSLRPEIAGGFGHTVYEIQGARGRPIGNSLHEAIMPPGHFQVLDVTRGTGQARSAFDGRTIYPTEQVRVRLRRVEPQMEAGE